MIPAAASSGHRTGNRRRRAHPGRSQSNLTDGIRPDASESPKPSTCPRAWPYRSLRGAKAVIDGVAYTVIGDPRPYTGGITPTRWNLTVELAATRG